MDYTVNRREFIHLGSTAIAVAAVDKRRPAAGGQPRQDLALNRPVMVSSVFYGPYQGAFAVDGSPHSWWASAAADPQYLIVDLQADCTIESVRIEFIHELGDPVPQVTRWTPAHDELAGYAVHYDVQVSADGKHWQTIFHTASGNGGTLTLDFTPFNARFVRLNSMARSWRQWGVGIRHFSVLGYCEHPRPAAAGWTAQRPPKAVPAATHLASVGGNLVDGWQLAMSGPGGTAAKGEEISRVGFDSSRWYAAVVPGTVLTTLVAANTFPEPLFGLNNLQIPEALNKYSWWYRKTFTLAAAAGGRRLWLHADGINFRAKFWLNGKPVGRLTGAFIRGAFDITELVKPAGENALAVCVDPVPHPGLPNEKSWHVSASINGGQPTRDGPNFFCTVGWDWICGIRDRCTGIWDHIYLKNTGPVTLANPFVKTVLPLPDTSHATLTVEVDVSNASSSGQTGVLQGTIEGISFSRKVTLGPGETRTVTLDAKDYPQLVLHQPRLWWPNGYGQPNLYRLNLTFVMDAGVSDESIIDFGVRTFTYEKLPELVISCNGQKIFVRGGDWGLDDAMKKLPANRMNAWIRLHQMANLNMIRNWTGESNSEEFFAQCDRHGIMVWTEFWMANPGDGPAPDDPGVVLANARDTILRYRHHACIVIWCGRNEGPPPAIINSALSAMAEDLDGTRYYQPGSSFAGVQSGGPYWYVDTEFYFQHGCNGFKTEIGTVSVPTVDSLRGTMPEADLWPPTTDVWAYHDFARFGAQNVMTYLNTIKTQFGPSTSVIDWNRKAQMLNYAGYRALFEGYAHKLWHNVSGVITWMSHPAQRSTVWQLYAHDLEAHASLYGAQKGCQPRHVQFCPLDHSVEVVNTTLGPLAGAKVSAMVFALDGRQVHSQEKNLDLPANARTPVFKLPPAAHLPRVYLISLKLHDAAGAELSDNVYWQGAKPQDLRAMNQMAQVRPAGKCSLRQVGSRVTIAVNLTHGHSTPAIMIKLTPRLGKDRILPAFISENYITLFKGDSKTILIEYDIDQLTSPAAVPAHGEPAVEITGWNIAGQTVNAAAGALAGFSAESSDWQIGPFVRPVGHQPIIVHNPHATFRDPVTGKIVRWEFSHTFNPAAIAHAGKLYVLYRAEDNSGKGIGSFTSRIGLASSSDGVHFQPEPAPVFYPQPGPFEHFEWPGGCEDPRIVQASDGTFVLMFTGWNRKVPRLCVATSRDLHQWKHYGPAFREALHGRFLNYGCKSGSILTQRVGNTVQAVRVNGWFWMYWLNGNSVGIARSTDLLQWEPLLDETNAPANVLEPGGKGFDSALTEPGPPALLTDAGIVLIYNGSAGGPYAAGQALFAATDPARLMARSAVPFFRPELAWEKHGQYAAGTTFMEGLAWFKGRWHLFYGAADTCVGMAIGPA